MLVRHQMDSVGTVDNV